MKPRNIKPRGYGRVGVLYGGTSAEREVSLRSGAGVHQALCASGVDAHLFDTGVHGLADLQAAGFDRVFIALHGRGGEDGALQGALELLGIPYTGSGVMACALALDKVMTKRLWAHHGLPTPDFVAVTHEDQLQAAAVQLGLPLILKPPHEGSTLGVTKVERAYDLHAAYQLAAGYDAVVLAEQYIRGRELTIAVLGAGAATRALPIIEIVAPGGNYDYEHKYLSDETQYLCPAPLDAALTASLQELARQAYLAVGCSGWGRVDLMLDAEHRPWLLEVNTSPGMTDHSLVPMAAKAEGVDYAELCLRILDGAACATLRPAPGRMPHGKG